MNLSKTGEPLDHVYQPSFKMGMLREDGEMFMMHPRVLCPKSEFDYYILIGKMLDFGYMNKFAHITAERMCFERGYVLVA